MPLVVAPHLMGAFDPVGDLMSKMTGQVIETMGDVTAGMLRFAFNNPVVQISDAEWGAALGQAARWGGVFAIVAIGLCAVEIVAGMISRDKSRVLRGWVFAAAAWPLTVASLLVFTRLVRVSDWLTNRIITTAIGDGTDTAQGAADAMAGMFGSGLVWAQTNGFHWLILLLICVVLLIAVILLTLVMGAIAFGQVALAGFAPVALMLVGFKGTRAMSGKWVEMAVTLILAKPLAAGLISLAIAMTASDFSGLIMGLVALVVALFSPAIAFKMIDFTGAQLSGAMTVHSDSAKGSGRMLGQGLANQAVSTGIGKLTGRTTGKGGTVAQHSSEALPATGTATTPAGGVSGGPGGADGGAPSTSGAPSGAPSGSGGQGAGGAAPEAMTAGEQVKDKAKDAAKKTAKSVSVNSCLGRSGA